MFSLFFSLVLINYCIKSLEYIAVSVSTSSALHYFFCCYSFSEYSISLLFFCSQNSLINIESCMLQCEILLLNLHNQQKPTAANTSFEHAYMKFTIMNNCHLMKKISQTAAANCFLIFILNIYNKRSLLNLEKSYYRCLSFIMKFQSTLEKEIMKYTHVDKQLYNLNFAELAVSDSE